MEINEVYCKDSVEFSDECIVQVDSIVTDPPYGIGYQNKDWDKYQDCVSFRTETWESVGKILKPGSYIVIFGASRTFHRLVCAVEESNFKIKDQLMWMYGQGMPKSHNIGKKLPEWEGWGTGLKPCYEPILLAQKPISEKTVVENVKTHGVGGLNIDATRVDGENGRWPGNVLHDGSEEVEKEFEKYGERGNGWTRNYGVEDYQGKQYGGGVFGGGGYIGHTTYADVGTASRFFYSTKSSVKERTHDGIVENDHPTVKNLALMEYLVKMVTPKDGIVYDPFVGSGTTLIAAKRLGFNFLGVDINESYVEISKKRLKMLDNTLDKFLS